MGWGAGCVRVCGVGGTRECEWDQENRSASRKQSCSSANHTEAVLVRQLNQQVSVAEKEKLHLLSLKAQPCFLGLVSRLHL